MVTIRIPTKHQYAYVEFQVEATPEEAHEIYVTEYQRYNQNGGLEPKEWNKVLDDYLRENEMNADIYASMSDLQKYVIQEIKKSIKRI